MARKSKTSVLNKLSSYNLSEREKNWITTYYMGGSYGGHTYKSHTIAQTVEAFDKLRSNSSTFIRDIEKFSKLPKDDPRYQLADTVKNSSAIQSNLKLMNDKNTPIEMRRVLLDKYRSAEKYALRTGWKDTLLNKFDHNVAGRIQSSDVRNMIRNAIKNISPYQVYKKDDQGNVIVDTIWDLIEHTQYLYQGQTSGSALEDEYHEYLKLLDLINEEHTFEWFISQGFDIS